MNNNIVSSFLRLIRWKNILIVMASMVIVWLFVNNHYVPKEDQTLDLFNLLLVILSTSIIAAAGYIINDYFDVKIDAINHPNQLIVSNVISRRVALLLHNVFNFIGAILIFYLCYQINNYIYLFIPVISIAILWFYSTHFKRMPLIGNIVVASLTLFSVFQLFIYEPYLYQFIQYPPILESGKNNPFYLITGISLLVFMLNLMRELVKDMEDLKGDAEQGCRTFPILYGLKSSAKLVMFLSIVTISLLFMVVVYFVYLEKWLYALFILVFSIIPIAAFIHLFPQKLVKSHFSKMSNLLKVIMISGLLLLFLLTI